MTLIHRPGVLVYIQRRDVLGMTEPGLSNVGILKETRDTERHLLTCKLHASSMQAPCKSGLYQQRRGWARFDFAVTTRACSKRVRIARRPTSSAPCRGEIVDGRDYTAGDRPQNPPNALVVQNIKSVWDPHTNDMSTTTSFPIRPRCHPRRLAL
jgi:hypothetical protein